MQSSDKRREETDAPASAGARARLTELALLFLRLGVTAFGGPAVHIAMMEREVVVRRRWLPHERFLDMMGAANLIPGPSSSELAIFIGYERAGLPGLLVAGVCFVLPAALMTAAIAWAYLRFGSLPRVSGVLYGIKPVVIATIVQALWGLAPRAIKRSPRLAVLGAFACLAAALDVDGITVLFGTGALSLFGHTWTRSRAEGRSLLLLPPAAVTGAPYLVSASLGALFLTFAKIGATVFGSGYVLVAFLRSDLVERLHWMTASQLIDAVAVGQVTPGPVFTTATFIGYLLAGGWGAVVATIGIFLPGFLLIAAIRPLVARIRRSPLLGAYLDGVNVASLALMAIVTVQLGRSALVDGFTIALSAVSALLLLRFDVNSAWLVAGGALAGFAVQGMR